MCVVEKIRCSSDLRSCRKLFCRVCCAPPIDRLSLAWPTWTSHACSILCVGLASQAPVLPCCSSEQKGALFSAGSPSPNYSSSTGAWAAAAAAATLIGLIGRRTTKNKKKSVLHTTLLTINSILPPLLYGLFLTSLFWSNQTHNRTWPNGTQSGPQMSRRGARNTTGYWRQRVAC